MRADIQVGDYRFIPAGAGNTPTRAAPDKKRTVYPRWRGEHAVKKHVITLCLRFIPAGAGNTLSASAVSPSAPVYPRWRGEHGVWVGLTERVHGLSPLARGTRLFPPA